MKLNNKTLFIILLALIAVFVIVKFTGNSERSSSFKEELVDIDTSAVTKIEIAEPGNYSQLVRKSGVWYVETGSKQYKAEANKVRSTMANLQSIAPTRIASRNESKWRDYNVDSTGTRVQVYESDKKTLDIVLGRFGVEGQQKFFSYVRLFEDKDTYVADNFMKMSVSADNSTYRNSNILRLEANSIVDIQFAYPDSSFTLKKEGSSWLLGGVEAVDSLSIAEYLSGLSYLTSRQFVESVAVQEDISVRLQNKTGDSFVLKGYQSDEGWIISSSFNEFEYFKDENAFSKIFRSLSSFKVQ